MRRFYLTACAGLVFVLLGASCTFPGDILPGTQEVDPGGGATDTPLAPTQPVGDRVETEADRDGVFLIDEGGERSGLLAPGQAFLGVGEGVDVDEAGRAILRFGDLLTVEVLRDGELLLQELSRDQQSAFITVLQNGGTLVNDFNPEEEIDRRLTVQTEFATITATGTRFLVVREAGSPLEWIVGLDSAEGDLEVTSEGVTKGVVSGQARWIAPVGEPSPGISADMGAVSDWIGNLQGGDQVREVGDVLWAPADLLVTGLDFPGISAVGEPFDVEGVGITLGPQGEYGFRDCNGDGLLEYALLDGRIELDLRHILNRVRALDVTVFNNAGVGAGELLGLDPARAPIESRFVEVGAGDVQVLSLRAEEPFHYAVLTMQDGCFLGFSLTPPAEGGEAGPPRSALNTGPFVRIDSPEDGSSDTVNGFTLEGISQVPFERNLVVRVETSDGEVIQETPLFVEGGDFGGPPGRFSAPVFVDAQLPADVVVRVQDLSARDGSILAEDQVSLSPLLPAQVERPPENGRIVAVKAGVPGAVPQIIIDGKPDDWLALQESSGVEWSPISSIVFDRDCANRYPESPQAPPEDVLGQVYMAYDQEFLYAAFVVEDEWFVGYSGPDERYYRGDAPQLLLDVDLAGDFDQPALSSDDLQVDLLPGVDGPGDSPSVALWQLESLTSQVYPGASIAAVPLTTAQRFTIVAVPSARGYFVEAALPWRNLGFFPSMAPTLGVAASLSDNDTPGTDVQECMISSAPQRDFRNPTTWGTLVLQP